MSRPYVPYVPQNISDMMDHLGMMMLSSPTFKNSYFTHRNIATVFSALNQGIENIKNTLGDERYHSMRSLSGRMRARFEADPEDKTDDSLAGRRIIQDMEAVLKSVYKK